MTSAPIHLCLVSSEVASIIVPALANGAEDPAFPPARVILLSEPRWRDRANYLKAALKSRSRKVTVSLLSAKKDLGSIEILEREIDKVLDRLSPVELRQLVLNASGGSRPLALAATSVFIRRRLPVFAVDSRRDYVSWLGTSKRANFNIPDHAKLEGFAARETVFGLPSPARDGSPCRILLSAWDRR